jgi:hypothetical protein
VKRIIARENRKSRDISKWDFCLENDYHRAVLPTLFAFAHRAFAAADIFFLAAAESLRRLRLLLPRLPSLARLPLFPPRVPSNAAIAALTLSRFSRNAFKI